MFVKECVRVNGKERRENGGKKGNVLVQRPACAV